MFSSRPVEQEIRGISYGSDSQADSAQAIVAAWLLDGSRRISRIDLDDLDVPTWDRVQVALNALPGTPRGRHKGEASLIALALRRGAESLLPQILFANDGGASQVAAREGLPTRHIGDVIAELECVDRALGGAESLALFERCCGMSAPPHDARQFSAGEFDCGRVGSDCQECALAAG